MLQRRLLFILFKFENTQMHKVCKCFNLRNVKKWQWFPSGRFCVRTHTRIYACGNRRPASYIIRAEHDLGESTCGVKGMLESVKVIEIKMYNSALNSNWWSIRMRGCECEFIYVHWILDVCGERHYHYLARKITINIRFCRSRARTAQAFSMLEHSLTCSPPTQQQ